MNMRKQTWRAAVSAAAIAASATAASSAHGRSLLYYYDFEDVQNGGLVYNGINRGSGSVELTGKFKSGSTIPYSTSGAFGSSGAYKAASNQNSLWLGDGSASLGCGTEKGFTLSFWMKTQTSHIAWTNPFGFRLAGIDYRIEYTTANNGNFTIYYRDSSGDHTAVAETIQVPEAGVWKHYAFVFRPNCGKTAGLGTCTIYIDGQAAGAMTVVAAGNLQQLHIGTWVRQNGSDRANQYSNSELDEVAVYDYPATAENVKWLARNKPAPGVVAMRAMPVMWPFDESSDNGTHRYYTSWTAGLFPGNAGTGTDSSYRWKGQFWTGYDFGALGTDKSFALYEGNINNSETFRVDGASATEGLGANLLDGAAVSFWIKAPANLGHKWQRVLSFLIGSNKSGRFEWDAEDPAIKLYGSPTSASGRTVLKPGEWTHVCMNWNKGISAFEFYVDGVNTNVQWPLANPTAADVFKSFAVGTTDLSSGKNNGISPQNVFVDEPAIFNHSLSDRQIAWLAGHIPEVTPLDTTNLVRTVSGNATWAKDGGASWTVRQWDEAGGTWENSQVTLCYPTMEDCDVESSVSFTGDATLTVDTLVTGKKVSFLNGGETAVAPALKFAEGARFEPLAMSVGNGVELRMHLYGAVNGTLSFAGNSKIVFDVSNYDGRMAALSFDAVELPEGESDVLAHFGVSDDKFTLELSQDGKTVYARLDGYAYTAIWAGTPGGSLSDPANWTCVDGYGVTLSDALPCEYTRVIVCSGSTALNVPAGTTIPWQYLRIEAGNATLAADSVDWRGIPVLCVPEGVMVDLNGKELRLNGSLEGKGTITSSVAGGELHIDVPEESSTTNATVAFTGSLKLVKDGDGTFTAACAKQAYTGGTEIADGTLKLGTSNLPLGAKNASVKICAGAVYDMNGCFSTSSCIYAYDLAGTMRSQTATESYGWNNAYRILGGTFVVSGDDARLELSNVYFACPDTTPAMFTMNGHTLTFDGTGYVGLGAFRSNDYGKWVFSDGDCIYEWLNGYGPTIVDVEVHAPALFKLKGDADVGGLVYEGTSWQKNANVSHLLVLRRYVAGPCHLPIQMCNGSTLDLSKITGSFDLTNTVANTAAASSGVIGDMVFQSGTAEAPSIINVNLAGKTDLIAIKNSESPYVVTWSSQPANVDFVLDAQSRANGYRIYSEAEGLRLKRFTGMVILVK